MFYWIKFIDILEKKIKKLREEETLHWKKAARSNYN